MKISNLQIIFLSIFAVALVAGVLIFAGVIPVGTSAPVGAQGNVVIWGTIKGDLMSGPIDALNKANKTYRIIYIEKNPGNFDTQLTEALASGQGPDIFFMTNDLIIRHSDKVFTIPFTSIPANTFRDTFVSLAEIYLKKDGIIALPFTVDPLVMYYNRDMFESVGVAVPPKTWDEFSGLAKKITTLGPSRNILKSAVSFGGFSNVTHAKDLLAAQLIQRGNPIISQDPISGFRSRLADTFGLSVSPASTVFGFYTDFANSVKDVYSWNPALPASSDSFISGDLAVYFGYASELSGIQARNPNLNFSVAALPQTKEGTVKVTYGRMNALAISKVSPNISTAYTVASQLSAADFQGKLSLALGLPPVRRDLLSARPVAPYYLPVFYDSALISRAWFDPSAKETDAIFKGIVDDINSGRQTAQGAVGRGAGALDLLVRGQ